MMTVPLNAKLLAPVVIRRDRQSDRSDSVGFVPGTVVRGALASIYLQQRGVPDDDFRHMFLDEGACRFHPLDPGPAVFPLTAATCKRGSLRHAIVDQLWFRVAQHLLGGWIPSGFEGEWRQCKRCGNDLKAHEGFWCQNGSAVSDRSHSWRRVDTHVGIDRHTETTADGVLYTLESLEPTNREIDLYGRLQADRRALECFTELLRSEGGRISVGHARTRGYGEVLLRQEAPQPPEDIRGQRGRWQAWSDDLLAFLEDVPISASALEPGSFFFSLSFPNGAVLVDSLLRYTIDPAAMISWLPVMSDPGEAFPVDCRPQRELHTGGRLRWTAAVTRSWRLRGWNAAHGLPRQDEWAVDRGATYVYCFQGSGPHREKLFELLGGLSECGVGLRRNEGFGQVLVSDDFHRHARQGGD